MKPYPMCRKTMLLVFGGLITTLPLRSQNEFKIWYFGFKAGLDFSTVPPTALSNGVMTANEGCASISDANGNILFYTDGLNIANKSHVAMDNGSALNGQQSSTQGATIVKQPGNGNLYYVFTEGGNLSYSIVDMNLAAGLGSVTAKNVALCSPTCEKQVVVRHCNGKDVWIVTHELYAPKFHSFLLTSSGINTTAVISSIGQTPNTVSTSPGQLKISPDGKKIAMATYSSSIPQSLGSGGLTLYDFDPSSGIVSNSLTLISENYAYGVEFSPDGSKLYCTRVLSLTTGGSSLLYQWDICNTNTTSIIASQYTVTVPQLIGAIQKAIDNKLYIAAGASPSLSVIHNPNLSGASMGFIHNDLSIAPKTSGLGFPNFINSYQKPLLSGFSCSVSCQEISVSAPTIPTFTSGCGGPAFQPTGYLWDFNDPGTGAANTSTLAAAKHNYLGLGTYTVRLIVYSNCANDTLTKVITISTPGPSLNVVGNLSICKGDRYTYSASGSNTYSWSSNANSATVSLSPSTTTAYTVSGTSNGCTTAKTFTISVSVCTDLANWENAARVQVFPNPFSESIGIKSEISSVLRIINLDGEIVLQQQMEPGNARLLTGHLSPGLYILESSNDRGMWRTKIMKRL